MALCSTKSRHNFLGRSAAHSSFMIWTHNMKNISFTDSFIPDSAPATKVYPNGEASLPFLSCLPELNNRGPALTLGAGVQWHEAYDAAHTRNVVVVGGLLAGGSVGAASDWVQGGGHSALAPAYGLGEESVCCTSLANFSYFPI